MAAGIEVSEVDERVEARLVLRGLLVVLRR